MRTLIHSAYARVRFGRARGAAATLAAALVLGTATARAEDATLGRYLPLYPGLYLDLDYLQDARDRVFDADGRERDTALPTLDGSTRLPLREARARLTWTFPLFESQDLPFFSQRLHTARLTLRYVRADTRGRLAEVVDANPLLARDGSGVGDTTLEFGSFLWGSRHWRDEASVPGNAGLLLIGLNVPTGVYEHEAPVNAGSNHWAFHARLGTALRPWRGAILEAGAGHRLHLRNEEPQFGGLAPSDEGDDSWLDLSLNQRLWRGVHLSLSFTERRGRANRYDSPQFAPNAPPPPNAFSDTVPTPGIYHDDGTALRTAGLSLSGFIGQRWLLGLSFVRPLAGASGEFALPFTNRQPAGCIEGAATCTRSPGETVIVDGLGPARSYASDRWMLSLRHNFGQGDAFSCTGCSR
ncbi:transporter [Sinimarinibacterium thermocellulolyticum]|uniref:Transporter n=1 Tax=Sinimarinibacterium thermocellulolyticum TaxID=3170016 RepID=A0ABV2AB00_9GAMM